MYKLLGLVRMVHGGGGEGDRSSVQTPHLGEDGAREGGRVTVVVYKLLGLVRMVHEGGEGDRSSVQTPRLGEDGARGGGGGGRP